MEIFDGWSENNLPPIGIEFLALWSDVVGNYVKCYSIGYNENNSLVYKFLESNRVGEFEEVSENLIYNSYISYKPLPVVIVEASEIKSIVTDINLMYYEKIDLIHDKLSGKYNEQLFQLSQQPTYDGDVISKQNRDFLIGCGLAVKICFDFKQGYTSVTPIVYSILKKRGYIL